MDNGDRWWPRPQPNATQRAISGVFLIVFIAQILSASHHWQLFEPYSRPALVITGIAFYLLVVRPLMTNPPSRKQQAMYVARSIREVLDGSGRAWDWDDFVSCSLLDPKIDAIRQRASAVDLPLADCEKPLLSALADEAETIASLHSS